MKPMIAVLLSVEGNNNIAIAIAIIFLLLLFYLFEGATHWSFVRSGRKSIRFIFTPTLTWPKARHLTMSFFFADPPRA
jgi:hypothetical protein